jgi:hypothetical protein
VEADAFNARELAAGRITAQDITAATRAAQESWGLVVDGKLGKATRAALVGPEDDPVGEPRDQLGEWEPPLAKIPGSRAEIMEVFGNPGTIARPNKRWRKREIITVRDLPGVPQRLYVQVHQLAEPYLREALRRASEASPYVVERCGVHVHRAIRGRSALSLHSWGIAADINPRQNSAKRFTRGSGPVPWSEEWTALWPDGVDLPFVEAMESVGWTWGGLWGSAGGDFVERAKRCAFFDPMHFELRAR